jgi:AraC family transcriptional regulator
LQRRIAHARELLANSELPLAEIALHCGFLDQSRFTTTFRKLSGVTPGQYRKSV